MSRWLKWGVLALTGPVAFAATGCGSSALETGYVPRRLNDSPAIRKAYYVSRFDPKAREAEQERQTEFRARRPGYQ